MTEVENAPAMLRCRQCGTNSLDDLGPIPPASVFAGQKLDPAWDGGSLYQCRSCHLSFRHPIKTEAEYEALYAKAAEWIWVSDALRADQRHVLAAIEAACPQGKVLDVGCYDGVLLAALDSRYTRFGVEASSAACEVARKRGIEIVASRIRDVSSIEMQFDVISAVDVIEHVEDPRAFVAMLADRLLPGGSLIISTGTLDAPCWRLAGGLFWYCSFPEHISFITRSWALRIAADLGLKVEVAPRFAYGQPGSRKPARERRRFVRKLLVEKLRRLVRAFAPVGNAHAAMRSYGEPGLFKDHMIVRFTKALP